MMVRLTANTKAALDQAAVADKRRASSMAAKVLEEWAERQPQERYRRHALPAARGKGEQA